MKKFYRLQYVYRLAAFATAFSFMMFLAPDVSAQGKQDFTLHNETGVEIHELYVSPHKSNDWEDDILGRDTLPNGDSVEVKFSPREKPKMWDVRVVDKDGDSLIWENLNLLEISEVTLYFKNGKAWAEFK